MSVIIRMKSDHHARTPSCFAVGPLPYPNAIEPASGSLPEPIHPSDVLKRPSRVYPESPRPIL